MSRLSMLMYLGFGICAANVALSADQVMYEVPLKDEDGELAPAAIMALDDVSLRLRKHGELRLRYSIPADLVGTAFIEVAMEAQFDPANLEHIKMKGERASGECTIISDIADCRLKIENLVVDLADVETYLTQQVEDVDLRAKKLAVAKIYSNEAQGVVLGVPLRRD